MAVGDGRYVTIAYAKQWLGLQQPSASNPTVYPGNVQGSPDDNIIAGAIQRAEADFDEQTGGWDQQSFTLVQPRQVFVDTYGWLWLYAVERNPVTVVSSVQILDLAGGDTAPNWRTLTWDAANGILLPPFNSFDSYPRPESWKTRIYPTNIALFPSATTDILARWSYAGGFSTIPSALATLIAEMVSFVYKSGREAILGQMVNQPLGNVTFSPVNYPKTIQATINRWRPKYG